MVLNLCSADLKQDLKQKLIKAQVRHNNNASEERTKQLTIVHQNHEYCFSDSGGYVTSNFLQK